MFQNSVHLCRAHRHELAAEHIFAICDLWTDQKWFLFPPLTQ